MSDPVIPSAKIDKSLKFREMSAACLLHISQLMDIGAYGVHKIRNGREVLVIRVERWTDDQVYVRRLESSRTGHVQEVPV